MLDLDNLRKQFGPVAALDGVSLRIGRGEMIGVIGRSGAGKSTLLRAINRLTETDSGAIRWADTDVSALKGRALRAWRARCAMIFQQYNLCDRLDVVTNVLVGCLNRRPLAPSIIKHFPLEDRARAIVELDRLGMADAALQRAGTLSGGQMQRVAIARALMQSPEIVLADEPVSSLDPHNSEVVMRALATINKERGITVIVNLHALDLARRFCGRIIGMRAGKVAFDGPPGALDMQAEARLFSTGPVPAQAA
jgi:phosphonate transport system ATP-binding protein